VALELDQAIIFGGIVPRHCVSLFVGDSAMAWSANQAKIYQGFFFFPPETF
jgi:hypothetical protein